MKLRSNQLPLVIWIVMLVADSSAQDDLGPTPTYPAAGTSLPSELRRFVPVESWPGQSVSETRLFSYDGSYDQVARPVAFAEFLQPLPEPVEPGDMETGDPGRFSGRFSTGTRPFQIGADLYSRPRQSWHFLVN